MVRTNAGNDMAREQQQIAKMISLFQDTLETQVSKSLDLFLSNLASSYSLDPQERIDVGGHSAPTLTSFGRTLNNSFDVVDHYTDRTNDPVTLFARDGQDFIRISTSLKKADGTRAIGTLLDRDSTSYKQLMADKPYVGTANLFGTPYITKYKPIHDDDGRVVGAWFLGVGIAEQMAQLTTQIRELGRGENGFAMLIDSRNGQVVAGGPYEGQAIRDIPVAGNEQPLAALLQKPQGEIHYRPRGDDTRARTTYYLSYPAWHWVIASTVVNQEVEAGIAHLKNQALWITLLVAIALAAVFYGLLRVMLGRPLAQVVRTAEALAGGDLTQRMTSRRRDEIGQLIGAMNGIGEGLSEIVQKVRRSVSTLSHGAETIARDTNSLSERSDQAASSLQQTSASLEEITATVENTASSADRARTLSNDTADLARSGNSAMDDARSSMQTINRSAEKIGEILTLMDSLAFQTNILALNASVEAARAGEHGRGFAVVAQEVRGLADRTAQAAGDIRTLIEQSTEDARNGDTQVTLAADRVAEILNAVSHVQTVVAEISEGAAQQNEGIQQINTAVNELDTTTQQNAGMVEDSSKAAQTIRDQASTLAELVSRLKVSEEAQQGFTAPAEPSVRARAPASPAFDTPAKAQPRARRTPVEPQPANENDDADWATF
ncbi:Cache 3/Cache 2 fusion domain-containing protein [Salinisphaera sp. SPP-AMP-43]|uniref:methyl-accepting chemotaxis protein n=1 Tax=Salinisphaera sp. SPP-AMP-43 TaxID=3121288 RepID=UPI003C6E3EA9